MTEGTQAVMGKGFKLLTIKMIDLDEDQMPTNVQEATGVQVVSTDALEQILEHTESQLSDLVRMDLTLGSAGALDIFLGNLEYILIEKAGLDIEGRDIEVEMDFWLVDNDTIIAELNAALLEESLEQFCITDDSVWDKIRFAEELAPLPVRDHCIDLIRDLKRIMGKA